MRRRSARARSRCGPVEHEMARRNPAMPSTGLVGLSRSIVAALLTVAWFLAKLICAALLDVLHILKLGTSFIFRSKAAVVCGPAVCGACEREMPEDSFSAEQRGRRQGIRRCEECVAAGNELALMKEGRTRSEDDDCPICQLPLPLDGRQMMFKPCCMKLVCKGCISAARKRGMDDCPFCRTPGATKGSQIVSMIQKRVDVGDPMAMFHLGSHYAEGDIGLKKDVTKAIELLERAAELGLKDAHYNLGCMYYEGRVVEKNTAKAIRHLEAAAVKGDVLARSNLGAIECQAGNHDLAIQHFLIAAKLGDQVSVDEVKKMLMKGLATKVDYVDALRGYQSVVEEMRSPNREEALALSSAAEKCKFLLRGR